MRKVPIPHYLDDRLGLRDLSEGKTVTMAIHGRLLHAEYIDETGNLTEKGSAALVECGLPSSRSTR